VVAESFAHEMCFSDAEARAQMEVNFHGPMRLIRAALPGFRKRKSGTLVNITSVAGIDGLPSSGMYAASKFALEGETPCS
jgi:NAD(P)-dependent dehydrogenase (short-subunit alcohol dehydrogenase family)